MEFPEHSLDCDIFNASFEKPNQKVLLNEDDANSDDEDAEEQKDQSGFDDQPDIIECDEISQQIEERNQPCSEVSEKASSKGKLLFSLKHASNLASEVSSQGNDLQGMLPNQLNEWDIDDPAELPTMLQADS